MGEEKEWDGKKKKKKKSGEERATDREGLRVASSCAWSEMSSRWSTIVRIRPLLRRTWTVCAAGATYYSVIVTVFRLKNMSGLQSRLGDKRVKV